jgi:glycosyltransferase involved in cell wall biosynthesis
VKKPHILKTEAAHNAAADTPPPATEGRAGAAAKRSGRSGIAWVDRILHRKTEPTAPDPDFDELTYLDLNPDVLQAVLNGQIASGYQHWLNCGSTEGRPLRVTAGLPDEWNEARYLRLNPEVAAGVRAANFASGYNHWTQLGSSEGRPGGAPRQPKTILRDALSSCSAGVNLFAFHGSGTGLGTAAQGYASAVRPSLSLQEIAIPWNLNELDGATVDPGPHAVNIVHMNPDALPFFLRRYGAKVLPNRFNVAIWVWELHAGYAHWQTQAKLFNEIWTPSTYSADAIRPVSKTPVHVIPHVVDDLPTPDAAPSKDRGVFQFLYIFDIASAFERKNPLALVRAFRKAFGNRQDVELVLKYHHADFDAPAVALMERVAKTTPNIRTVNQTLPDEQVYTLLRSCDCFASPHRSEGFGLNIAAAMYYGKPVIATGYSGNMDFTTPQNSFLIDYDLVEVQQRTGAYKAGYVWAEPSEDHLAALLRTVAASPDEARERAQRGRQTIQARFSVKAVSEIIGNRFREWGL